MVSLGRRLGGVIREEAEWCKILSSFLKKIKSEYVK